MLTQYGEKSCTKLVVPASPFFGDESCVGSQFAKPFDDHLFGLLVDI